MKKFAFVTVCAILAVSCSKEYNNDNSGFRRISFTATSEAQKTTLNDGVKVFWSKSDKIGIIAQDSNGNWLTQKGSGAEFIIADAEYVPSTSAVFSGSLTEGATPRYAVYPYYSDGKRELRDYGDGEEEEGIDINLPWTLTGVPGGFPANSNIMIGSFDQDGNVAFKNVCALAKFTVTDENVTSVSFSTNKSGALSSIAGHAYIKTADATIGRLASTKADVSSTVTLTVPEPGSYYIPFLPNKMPDGFNLALDMKDGTRKVRTHSSASSFERNTIYNMGSDTDPGFVSEDPGKITLNVVFSNGTTTSWPFSPSMPKEADIKAAGGAPMGPFTFDGKYDFFLRIQTYVKAESCRITGGAGFRFGGTKNDYLLLPGIPEYALTSVSITCGTQKTTVAVTTNPASGDPVELKGGEARTIEKNSNGTFTLTETEEGVSYRLNLPESDSYTGIQLLSLTYTKKPFGTSSSISDPQFRQDEEETEDKIPDFSRVGYHYGDDDIPLYTNVVTTLTPPADGSDALDLIQGAIDACDGKIPSVVLLKAGTYRVKGTIRLRRSNLVLRGEKDKSGKLLTRILATSVNAQAEGDDSGAENEAADNLLVIGDANGKTTSSLMAYEEIAEDYVPVGRMYVKVRNASAYRPGDRVSIYRPATQNWIHDIKMDDISDGENWIRSDFNMNFERIVTAVNGDRVYFDNPVVMAIDSKYGGGLLTRINVVRIKESGVEDICFDSVYDKSNPYDENHTSTAVKVNYAEHCWVRGVEGHHFIFSTVGLGTRCRNISVLNCASYEPVSLIQGRRRYAFNTGPYASLGLFKNCTADHDRHQFVSTTLSCGPTVYTRCTATNCHSNSGPHCFWAAGFLYDCIRQDGNLTVEDADSWGTGASQGWQGVNHVFWNCKADVIVCQSPWVSGQNWCVGCIGTKTYSTHSYVASDTSKRRPDGKWYPDPGYGHSNTGHFTGTVFGVTTTSESLYESQLAARKAAGIRVLPLELY